MLKDFNLKTNFSTFSLVRRVFTHMKIRVFFLLFSLSPFLLQSQVGEIALYNSSFEDIPRSSLPPRGWIDCGFPGETPPDVQPSGEWEVYRPAYHGHSYLGMVARENNTWESVGQRLTSPLLKGKCYSFSLYMCMSSEYWSPAVPDTIVDKEAYMKGDVPKKNFNKPIVMRIWGGDGYCSTKEVIAESEPIGNTYWEKYTFKFEPNRDISHIILQAYYKTPALFPYNGNVLVDNASVITMIGCDESEAELLAPAVQILQPIEKIDPAKHLVKINATIRNINSRRQISFKVNGTVIKNFDFDPATSSFATQVHLKGGRNTVYIKAKNLAGEAADETSVYIPEKGVAQQETPPPPEPEPEPEPAKAEAPPEPPATEFKLLTELNEVEPEAGQIFKVKGLVFLADSSRIEKQSQDVLDELFEFLEINPEVTIEIGGHTNGTPPHSYCDPLSQKRARSVSAYLESKGIKGTRLQAKGYGKRFPIASNETPEGRTKNQRVEIKILSTS